MLTDNPLDWQDSPVQAVNVNDFAIYVKRDDLLHRDFSGNKARKFAQLSQQSFTGITKLVSYGSAQSNAMYSLSVLAKHRGLAFDYYVDHMPRFLALNPAGNYRGALANGAKIITRGSHLSTAKHSQLNLEDYVQNTIIANERQCLFIPEGGRFQSAQQGLYRLADEIITWAHSLSLAELSIFLPAGTGTTALFIQQRIVELGLPFKVLTCACVGSDDYLKQQFSQLNGDPLVHPIVIPQQIATIDPGRRWHFGKLNHHAWQLWLALTQQTAIEFDLLYDPLGWRIFLAYLATTTDQCPHLYIHQGGLLGNETMVGRYRRRFGHL